MRGYYIVHDYQLDKIGFAPQKGSKKRALQYNPQTSSDGATTDSSIPAAEGGLPSWATWTIVGSSVAVLVVVIAVVVYCVQKKKEAQAEGEEGNVKKQPKKGKKNNETEILD